MGDSVPDRLQPYFRDAVSNGNPREQANIRRWWHEECGGRGILVWEYQLEGRFLDGVLFPGGTTSCEEPGLNLSSRFPIENQEIVLCEAKRALNPELIGQALVYRELAARAGAIVRDLYAFAETGDQTMIEVAGQLGIRVVLLERTLHPTRR